ncbi:MAG: 16S rRNA (guanine(966)-N(2))-methyltransferase RsmD [Bacteroidota bacterium]
MRIVGGKYKGRIFNPDKRFTARPTTDLAKESLFNILANRYDFSEMKILDLFSGTGSIGYEFLSREAGEVTFVDKDHHHIRFIRKITGQLNAQNVRIIQDDVFRFLKNCPFNFDIVFADPPYEFPFLNEIPKAVFESEVLKEGGLLILEHSKSHDFSKIPQFSELRKYGKVQFSFFRT